MALSALDVAVITTALYLIYKIRVHTTKTRYGRHSHPPGPPGLPLLGNLRDFPADRPWVTYKRWSQTYDSDVIQINVFGANIVVLDSMQAATDLLEKRSLIYSDRPDLPMLNELCRFGWNTPFMRYGSEWRKGRRAFQQHLHAEGVKQYRPQFEASTHRFLRSLLHHPENLMQNLRHLAGAEIMKVAYGIDVKTENDPFVETAEQALQAIAACANPGSFLVDVLPILKYVPEWFPGAGFQKQAKTWEKHITTMRDAPFEYTKSRKEQGSYADCVLTSLLADVDRDGEDAAYSEDDVKSALGSMFVGGSDTTVSALGTFFLAMVLYPDVQRKAREQIDAVCQGRLPDIMDRDALPYVTALVKESVRWHNVVPLNLAHRVTTDDVYKGYVVAKDSVILANIWSILHDDKAYPEPTTYNPDRFMKNGQLDPDVQDPTLACFGFGRRICPGRFMALETMWLTIAKTLAVFEIAKAKDENGEPITPEEDYFEDFLCYPKPFPCNIVPRSAEHKALIDETGLEESF